MGFDHRSPASAAFALLGALLLSGCPTGNAVCSRDCPAVEGAWQITFDDVASTADCDALGVSVPNGELRIQRSGGTLTGTFNGRSDYTGRVFDTGELTLAATVADGGTELDDTSFRARHVVDVRDGGFTSLDGTYDLTVQRSTINGPRSCRLSRAFTGVR